MFALVDGSIDAQRYEDSCRLLLGNHAYLMFTLDKVVQQTLKCLQAMVNDDVVNKLVGLFVYYRSKHMPAVGFEGQQGDKGYDASRSVVEPAKYQAHVGRLLAHHNAEDVYRIQLLSGE